MEFLLQYLTVIGEAESHHLAPDRINRNGELHGVKRLQHLGCQLPLPRRLS
jgi:hypothetical protein